MAKMKNPRIERTSRTDAILFLEQVYSGELDTPQKYNKAFAKVLRHMADAAEDVKDMWVDPEVVVWMHEPDKITAELPLSPMS